MSEPNVSQEMIQETVAYLQSLGISAPEFGVVLGSGLGELAEELADQVVVPYEEIPNFPKATVAGHKGRLIYGDFEGKKVLAMQGRFHYYEGNTIQQVVYPIHVMAALGIKKLVVTNAAGGVNGAFEPGTLMVLTDHINFTGRNPLIGINEELLGPRFPDLSQAYSQKMKDIAYQCSQQLAIPIKEGVYMAFSGPSYETPAEIRMARGMGADAVGMSTVPEVIVGAYYSMEILAVSCITNLAAGLQIELNHEEVIEVSNAVKGDFKQLVRNVILMA